MTAAEYIRHTYRPIVAGSYKEAVELFFAKYHYTPAPVFGPKGCPDALNSNYVPNGFYFCAIREN